MDRFIRVFGRAKDVVIGMVHVRALPGSPGSRLNMDEIVSKACDEMHTYLTHKLDGVIVENMHDVPWMRPEQLGPETVSAMTVVCSAMRRLQTEFPVGVQILSSGNRAALAIAKAADLQFVRAEGWVFAHVGDEGYVESCAADLARYRRHLNAEHVLFFTDIKKKHSSHMLTSDVDITHTAQAAELFLSDGVVVTGTATGSAVNPAALKDVCKAVKQIPVLVGSGVTDQNIHQYVDANAFIIGSHFKVDGQWTEELDSRKIGHFMDCINRIRETQQ